MTDSKSKKPEGAPKNPDPKKPTAPSAAPAVDPAVAAAQKPAAVSSDTAPVDVPESAIDALEESQEGKALNPNALALNNFAHLAMIFSEQLTTLPETFTPRRGTHQVPFGQK